MFIHTSKPVVGVKYYLAESIGGSFISEYILTSSEDHPFYSDTTLSYLIFSKLQDSIVAGTFEFHGINDSNQRVDITKGFFDINQRL